jgi:UDP-N-acetylglucosamine acyltransferase
VNIHSTAVIHPKAELHPTVTVGPYAVIEGAAVIGEDCTIAAHAIIGAHVAMGARNAIGYGAVIGADPQDFAFKPEVNSRVVIGDDNRIREYVTIHRGTAEGSDTRVGSGCFLMAGAHLAHNVHLGDRVILANNVLLGGHVVIADGVFIGGACVFHQHIRVGRLAICQGASAFSKDVPPFVVAAERNGVAGLNVVGLRRAGFAAADRADIKRAFDLLYRSGRNITQALALAKEQAWSAAQPFWDFVAAAKKKGLCDWLGSRRGGLVETEEGDAE